MITTVLILAVFAYALGSPDPAARAGRKGARVGVASGALAGRAAWARTQPRRDARSRQAVSWLRRTWLGRRVLDATRVLEGVGAAFWWSLGAAKDVAVVAGSAVAGGARAVGPGTRDAWRSRHGGQPEAAPEDVPTAGVVGQPEGTAGHARPDAPGQPAKVPAATPDGQPDGQPPGQPATGRPPHLTVVPDPPGGTLPGPPLPPPAGSPTGQPATTSPGTEPGSTDSTTGTQPGSPDNTPKEQTDMPQAPQDTAALVAEWTNIDDAIKDADTIRARVLAILDELAELAAHSRAMPDRMQAAPFHPGPAAAVLVTALVDATPEPQRLTDWADAAHATTVALRAVKATVGEQVDTQQVSGEARAFASA